jgi:FtsP/CotA-like multicopper oxidase with cupredoxin domain
VVGLSEVLRACGVIALFSCALTCTEAPEYPNHLPEGWASELELPVPEDLNPDPNVLEINLTARVETLSLSPTAPSTEVYTYDGNIPGPLIELTAGDRLVVHFTNELPEPTTIHWHGLQIPNDMDGVPNHPRPPIQPGESFTYDFVVPDAGLFWYHPHVNSVEQVGAGLYGALLVRPDDESEVEAPPDEVVLVLSDIGINEEGELVDPEAGGDLGTLFGREGNLMLVNGKWRPSIDARAGITQRWRIVNAARSRYFQLELPGATFTQVGGDSGLLPEPIEHERLVVVPGQRMDVLVTPSDAEGSEQVLEWIPYDRGFGSTEFRPEEDLMQLRLIDLPPGTPTEARMTREVAPLDTSEAIPVEVRLTQMTDEEGALLMGINDIPFSELEPFPATVGQTQIWTLQNETEWNHPFHLHGFFFQEVDENDQPLEPPYFQDSLDVPAQETRRIALHFDERPGMWMFHCHILDHAAAGMMGLVELVMP